ncbi:MAG: glycosyltransferase family 2 protein [Planctomycetota bacterium]
MKTTCLINSHNYIQFVGEAIQSALEQSFSFDEIIVVDDGSTDGSVEYLRSTFGAIERVQILAKHQAGQLSCFNHGLRAATGELVFFLDADDRYDPHMLESVLPIYSQRTDIDFVSVGVEEFGGEVILKQCNPCTRDCGYSVLGTYFNRAWIGNPTSCISARRKLLEKVLPYPDESSWQTRADDVLVFGSSLVGGHKFHLAKKLVQYRVHQSNHYSGQRRDVAMRMQHGLRVNQLIQWYIAAMGYDASTFGYLVSREFRTIESPTVKELRRYLGILSRAGIHWGEGAVQRFSILRHYLRSRTSTPNRSLDALSVSQAAALESEIRLAKTGLPITGAAA